MSLWVQTKGLRGHSEKAAMHKPGRELSTETKFASTLIMDSELRKSVSVV